MGFFKNNVLSLSPYLVCVGNARDLNFWSAISLGFINAGGGLMGEQITIGDELGTRCYICRMIDGIVVFIIHYR